MNSIRSQLLLWLRAGLGLLWLAAAIVAYGAIRTGQLGKFDAELRAMASEVRYLLPESRAGRQPEPNAYWFDFFRPGSGLYFEAWDEFGIFSDRSPSLGDKSLPAPAVFTDEPAIWNFSMPGRENVRAIALRLTLPAATGGDWLEAVMAEPRVIHVVVARNRDALDRSHHLLMAVTVAGGLLIIPLSLIIVRLAVSRALRPLQVFAKRVETIGPDSLHERFPVSDLPAELVPVSRRLNDLMERLQRGLERERRLNADLAHELRTPAAELRTMAEVALAWPDTISADHYRDVLEVSRHMQSIINSMLLLARWDQAGEKPVLSPVHSGEIIQKCIVLYREAAEARNLVFEVSVTQEEPLEANEDLLLVILGNLISNAVEYAPGGTTIKITAPRKHEESHTVLTVENEANTLTMNDLPNLFDRFWRGDQARTGGQHAGLGLPLARACARAMGLELTASLTGHPPTLILQLEAPNHRI